MKIGVLGGTFDPPHKGHLALAQAAADQLGLDEVIFMPAFQNPLKGRKVATKPQDRFAMVEAMVRGAEDARLALSDLEITRGGPSYTVDTMTELQMARPADYWFLLGADSLKGLPTWKQPQRLIRLCRIGAVLRHPVKAFDVLPKLPEEFRPAIDLIEMPSVDISSTDLRDRLARGQNVSPWIPVQVLKYISTHRLY
jgi:nicotinate-nucleotide adenylyltransferase